MEKIEKIPVEKRTYVDECGINKCLVREYGRAVRGVKIEDVKRGRKFQRINVIAAQYKDEHGKIKHVAALCYKESMNSERFEDWFRTKLVKAVPKGNTIIMDRASFHREKRLRNLARRHGLKLQLLPAYSPDLNPIEKTWANMKFALIDTLPNDENLENSIYLYLDS